MPGEDSPFLIEILDRTFDRRGFVGAPLALSLAPRHMAPAYAELTVSNTDKAVPLLLPFGARLRITYAGETHTGPVRRLSGKGAKFGGSLTFAMDGDFRLFADLLGWQVPTADLEHQSREYDVRRGPAETVAKALLADNARRAGVPLRVVPSQGRGRDIRVNMRMQPIADLLIPAVDAAGIGLTVVQDGPGFVLDAYQPADYPRTLTEDSGVIAGWEPSREAPTATRVVVGGGGEGVLRDYVQLVDADREAEWGDVIEVFRDADDAASDFNSARDALTQAGTDVKDRTKDLKDADRDVRVATLDLDVHPSDTDKQQAKADALKAQADARKALDAANSAYLAAGLKARQERQAYLAELDSRGRETLAEGAPTAGLKVTLSQTKHFVYGGPTGLHVGDRFRMEVGPGVVVDDLLREVVISWTADGGLQVTPTVGDLTSDTDKRLVARFKGLAAAVRALRAGR